MKSLLSVTLILIILSPAVSQARTWTIDPLGTGDAPNIQAGIDSAAAADTVLLLDGTFYGPGNRDIDFMGKAITVMSQAGDYNLCTIDCEGTSLDPHRGFIFDSNETQTSVLRDITIRDGYKDNGGAVVCDHSSPTIMCCYFSNNTAVSVGGAIDMVSSEAEVTSCLFTSNQALAAAGAIYTEVLSPAITDCNFNWNTSSGNGRLS